MIVASISPQEVLAAKQSAAALQNSPNNNQNNNSQNTNSKVLNADDIDFNIFNPASAVDALGGTTEAGQAVQAQPQISSLSKLRAASGDGRLSFQTKMAIAQGAAPPVIISKEDKIAEVGEEVKNALSPKNNSPSSSGSIVSNILPEANISIKNFGSFRIAAEAAVASGVKSTPEVSISV